jgi:hypothetical protein
MEALPLIEVDEEGNFSANIDAVCDLHKIEGKIAVVSIAGIYRSGKSSLMNWLTNRPNIFAVGSTTNRCTRGIWMWPEPILSKTPEGEDCSVILLDTEGIGGVEADSKYDARIFSLAVLLSSTLIFNSMGSIDENSISNLSFMAQLSNMIRLKAAKQGTSTGTDDTDADPSSDFGSFFPDFLWTIRDFSLSLEDKQGRAQSAEDYLESCLQPVANTDQPSRERNRIRSMITGFFPQRKCVLLARPLSDETALQNAQVRVNYDGPGQARLDQTLHCISTRCD